MNEDRDALVAIARAFPAADMFHVAKWGSAWGTARSEIVAIGDVGEISFAPVAASGRGIYVVRFVRTRGAIAAAEYIGDRLVHVK